LVSEQLVIFVTATTGQGDPPKNMKVKIFGSFALIHKHHSIACCSSFVTTTTDLYHLTLCLLQRSPNQT